MRDKNKATRELVFDATRPPKEIEFLGLVEGSDGSSGKYSGLFRWKCPACGKKSQSVTPITLQQPFLERWACKHCSEEVLVKFRSRPATDWIAQHALAITGKELYELACNESSLDKGKTCERENVRSQTVFAATAIPALLVIIFLGVSDITRTGRLLGFTAQRPAPKPKYYSHIAGRWVDEKTGEQLHFGRIDLNSQVGTYMRIPPGGDSQHIMQFQVLDGIAGSQRLVLRELGDLSDDPEIDSECYGGILYIPKYGASITRMDTVDGQMLMSTYHRAREE